MNKLKIIADFHKDQMDVITNSLKVDECMYAGCEAPFPENLIINDKGDKLCEVCNFVQGTL